MKRTLTASGIILFRPSGRRYSLCFTGLDTRVEGVAALFAASPRTPTSFLLRLGNDSETFDVIPRPEDDFRVDELLFVMFGVTFLEVASSSNCAGLSAKLACRSLTSP
ncbi:hypothetical protein L6452_31935 [Arctium lappa]|uniref:Uncharacterized protein n=1 Tax=Arctium lappa TaxID=4217 RepID=A0ACB8Z426_ARCLA|nr:hypothetical protein L6452_31935 [Arctium lappa]